MRHNLRHDLGDWASVFAGVDTTKRVICECVSELVCHLVRRELKSDIGVIRPILERSWP